MLHHMAEAMKLDMQDRQSTKKLVLLCYANHANERDEVWPFRDTVAREAGISDSTLGEYISEFRELGILVEVDAGKGRRRSTMYELHLERAVEHWGLIAKPERTTERMRREREKQKREEARARQQARKTAGGPPVQGEKTTGGPVVLPEKTTGGPVVLDSKKPPVKGAKTTGIGGKNHRPTGGPPYKTEKIEGGAAASEPLESSSDGAPSGRAAATSAPTSAASSPASTAEGSAKAEKRPKARHINERWRTAIAPKIEARIGEIPFQRWLGPSTGDRPGFDVLADTGKEILFRAPSRFAADWIRSNYVDLIEGVIGPGCHVTVVTGSWRDLKRQFSAEIDQSWKFLEQWENED